MVRPQVKHKTLTDLQMEADMGMNVVMLLLRVLAMNEVMAVLPTAMSEIVEEQVWDVRADTMRDEDLLMVSCLSESSIRCLSCA